MPTRDAPPPHMPVPALHRAIPQYLARRLWQIAATLQSEALMPYGLAPWQAGLLAQLSETPGMDRNWLAAAIGIDATSTGQALTAFEARGLVSRATNPTDRRANAFSLTPAGEALRAELRGPVREVARRLLSPLSEAEAATLLALLARLVDAHQSHARPGAGRRPPRRAGRGGEAPCPAPASDGEPPSAAGSGSSSGHARPSRKRIAPGLTVRSA